MNPEEDKPGAADKVRQLIEPCFVQKVWWEWLKASPTEPSAEAVPVFLAFRAVSPNALEKAFRDVLNRQVVLRFRFMETSAGLRVTEQVAEKIEISQIDLTLDHSAEAGMVIAHQL